LRYGVRRDILADVNRDLGLCNRLGPARKRKVCAGWPRAFSVRKRSEARRPQLLLHRLLRRTPTFQPSARSPDARRWRLVSRLCFIPRMMRGSSHMFMNCFRRRLRSRNPRSSRRPSSPDQHDIFVRRVVESVPAAARRIDHVAFDRGSSPSSL